MIDPSLFLLLVRPTDRPYPPAGDVHFNAGDSPGVPTPGPGEAAAAKVSGAACVWGGGE